MARRGLVRRRNQGDLRGARRRVRSRRASALARDQACVAGEVLAEVLDEHVVDGEVDVLDDAVVVDGTTIRVVGHLRGAPPVEAQQPDDLGALRWAYSIAFRTFGRVAAGRDDDEDVARRGSGSISCSEKTFS